MSYKGLLELTGVWPSAPVVTTQAGFSSINDLSGAILTGGTTSVIQAGFIGVQQLLGLWVTGAGEAVIEPPVERGGGGAGTEYIRRKDLIEEENAIILAVIQSFLDNEG